MPDINDEPTKIENSVVIHYEESTCTKGIIGKCEILNFEKCFLVFKMDLHLRCI